MKQDMVRTYIHYGGKEVNGR